MDPGIVAFIHGRLQGQDLDSRSIVIASLAPIPILGKVISAEDVCVAEAHFHILVLGSKGVETFQGLDGR